MQFATGDPLTIAAISGLGGNEWTGKEVTNQEFKDIKECLNPPGPKQPTVPKQSVNEQPTDPKQSVNEQPTDPKQSVNEQPIIWADLTYEHEEYQQLQREPIKDDHRKKFAEECKQRMRNKAQRIRQANLKSPEDLFKVLKKLAEYRPEYSDDIYITDVVDYYWNLATNKTFLEQQLVVLYELICGELNQQALYDRLCMYPQYRSIVHEIERASPSPSESAQYFKDEFLEPLKVPRVLHYQFCVAFGFIIPDFSSKLADLTVQCAEDNALKCLHRKNKNRNVVSIEWYSATLLESADPPPFFNKPLCAFCAIAFEPRAKQINSMK